MWIFENKSGIYIISATKNLRTDCLKTRNRQNNNNVFLKQYSLMVMAVVGDVFFHLSLIYWVTLGIFASLPVRSL